MSARMRIVEEHVTRENEHNLDGIMDTFGETARYDDEAWGAHYHASVGGLTTPSESLT